MKAIKIIGNLFGILLASILSLVLVVVLIAAPMVTAVSSFTQPETIREIITNIDYKTIFVPDEDGSDGGDSGIVDPDESKPSEDDPGVVDPDEEDPDMGNPGEEQPEEGESSSTIMEDIPSDALNEMMSTSAFQEIIDLYTEDLLAAVEGSTTETALTTDAVKDIVSNNVDELADIAHKYIREEGSDVSQEEIKSEILNAVDEIAPEITKELGTFKEQIVAEMSTEIREVVRYAANGTFTWLLWGAIAGLSLLIFLFRLPRGKGLMWLCVLFYIGAAFSGICYFAFNSVAINLLKDVLEEMGSGLILPAMGTFVSNFGQMALIFLGIGTVCLVLFILWRKALARKRKKADAAYKAAKKAEREEKKAAKKAEEPALVAPVAEEVTVSAAKETPAESLAEETLPEEGVADEAEEASLEDVSEEGIVEAVEEAPTLSLDAEEPILDADEPTSAME